MGRIELRHSKLNSRTSFEIFTTGERGDNRRHSNKLCNRERAVYTTDDGVTASYLRFLAGIFRQFERRPNEREVETSFDGLSKLGFFRDAKAVAWEAPLCALTIGLRSRTQRSKRWSINPSGKPSEDGC
jgi:hypothetical protein